MAKKKKTKKKPLLPLVPGAILALDPGNTKTGWAVVVHDPHVMGHLRVRGIGVTKNQELRRAIYVWAKQHEKCFLAVETPRPRGMPTAAEEMETLIMIGRFLQLWRGPWTYVFRQTAKINLTGAGNSKDAHVRQALIDRFGGDSVAIGGKKCSGCKGKGVVGRARCPECLKSSKSGNDCEFCEGGTNKDVYCKEQCDECDGDGYESPPGPFAEDFNSHTQAALAVACVVTDSPDTPEIHEVAGKQAVKKNKGKKRK